MNLILTTGLLIGLGIKVVEGWQGLEPTVEGGEMVGQFFPYSFLVECFLFLIGLAIIYVLWWGIPELVRKKKWGKKAE